LTKTVLVTTALLALLTSATHAGAENLAEGADSNELRSVAAALDLDLGSVFAELDSASAGQVHASRSDDYDKYKSMRNAGIVLTTGVSTVLGLGTAFGLVWVAMAGSPGIFVAGIVVTAVTFVTGLILWIVGQKRKNQAEPRGLSLRAPSPVLDRDGAPGAPGLTFWF
jgi:hypothetical protein